MANAHFLGWSLLKNIKSSNLSITNRDVPNNICFIWLLHLVAWFILLACFNNLFHGQFGQSLCFSADFFLSIFFTGVQFTTSYAVLFVIRWHFGEMQPLVWTYGVWEWGRYVSCSYFFILVKMMWNGSMKPPFLPHNIWTHTEKQKSGQMAAEWVILSSQTPTSGAIWCWKCHPDANGHLGGGHFKGTFQPKWGAFLHQIFPSSPAVALGHQPYVLIRSGGPDLAAWGPQGAPPTVLSGQTQWGF